MANTTPSTEGILIEIRSLGNCAKVNAIDTVTGTEITLLGPANAESSVLQAAAMRKLAYVMKKGGPSS